MEKIVQFLTENPIGTFATVIGEKPRTRPWGFAGVMDGKFYFTTNNTKEVYRQLQENPNMEFTSSSKEMTWLRLSGKAVFVKDLETKKAVMDNNPPIQQMYQSPDNPIFEVFYIENAKASIHEFGGKPIVEVTL